ncbi:MAG: hypothetical protein JWQ97_81, partial [Phenylobacterium sp.]|nr:hypothetical protein [Phenylobacterium sp.]
RGPQGTLYGRNTTGGAVSIYTNDPTDTLGGSVDVSAGNYSAYNAVGVVNVPLAPGLAARLVVQRGEHGGYVKDLAGHDLADQNAEYYRLKVRADLGENVRAVLSASYQHNRTGGTPFKLAGIAPNNGAIVSEVVAEQYLAGGGASSGLGAALGDPARIAQARATLNSYANLPDFYTTGGTAQNYSIFTGHNLGLNVEAKLPHQLTLRSISGYSDIDRNNQNEQDGTPFSVLTPHLRTQAKFVSEELQLLGGDPNFNWVAGVFASDEKGTDGSVTVTIPAISAANPNIQDASIENKSTAVFGQANWRFLPQWGLTAGYRYSNDDRTLISRNRNPVSGCLVPAPGVVVVVPSNPSTSQCPRTFSNSFTGSSWLASVNYRPSEAVMIYVKAARGYRTGGENLRGSSTATSFASFAPETTTEYEVGAKTDLLDRRLRLNVAAYYDDYKNIQRSVIVPTPTGASATIVTNAAAGKIKGVEAEAEFHPIRQLTLTASYGLVDAKYDSFRDLTGDRSQEGFGVPKTTWGVGGRYVAPTAAGDLSLDMDYRWQSKVALAPETASLSQVTQKAFGLLNGRIALQIEAWDAEVSIFGKNITAEEYYVSATSLERALGYNVVQIGDPRTYGVEFKKRFGGI